MTKEPLPTVDIQNSISIQMTCWVYGIEEEYTLTVLIQNKHNSKYSATVYLNKDSKFERVTHVIKPENHNDPFKLLKETYNILNKTFKIVNWNFSQ